MQLLLFFIRMAQQTNQVLCSKAIWGYNLTMPGSATCSHCNKRAEAFDPYERETVRAAETVSLNTAY
jgi:7-cyano-7-deazaguanine synthase in queuosine biosynthesis